jgi:hypothetical protein
MMLTPDQIEYGFWSFRPEDKFPPPAITYPEEYAGDGISSYRQRELVESWCESLPDMNAVRYLWLNSRVNQPLFEAACSLPGLEGLFIKWGALTELTPLAARKSLQYLHIGSAAGVRDIRPLSEMDWLLVLEIENFNRVRDLEPLVNLNRLEGLAVTGSTWTTWKIDSLAPLGSLKSLRYMFLTNLKADDGTLKPLTGLKGLVNLQTAYWWPAADFAKLRAALPELRYGTVLDEAGIDQFAT